MYYCWSQYLCQNENYFKFESVYFKSYFKSLRQPTYTFLRKFLKPSKGIGHYDIFNENVLLPPLFIFDDVTWYDQGVIREYFSMGRHNHLNSIILNMCTMIDNFKSLFSMLKNLRISRKNSIITYI